MFGWIFYSVCMLLASVVMYLFIRKGQRQGMTLRMGVLSMFLIPLLIYAGVLLATHTSFAISIPNLFIILFASIFFSYIGNMLSQKSMMDSPNPGYTLSITKSYVVFTSLFSFAFFHSPLPFKSIIAIVLIVIFSAVISIEKKTHHAVGQWWLLSAFGSFFCFASLALASSFILKHGVEVFVYLFYLFLFVNLCIFGEMLLRGKREKIEKSTLFTLFVIGITSMFFNLFMQLGYKVAPNPGFINAANTASIMLVTLLASFFFKDELSVRKIIGIVGITIGLLLLFL